MSITHLRSCSRSLEVRESRLEQHPSAHKKLKNENIRNTYSWERYGERGLRTLLVATRRVLALRKQSSS